MLPTFILWGNIGSLSTNKSNDDNFQKLANFDNHVKLATLKRHQTQKKSLSTCVEHWLSSSRTVIIPVTKLTLFEQNFFFSYVFREQVVFSCVGLKSEGLFLLNVQPPKFLYSFYSILIKGDWERSLTLIAYRWRSPIREKKRETRLQKNFFSLPDIFSDSWDMLKE